MESPKPPVDDTNFASNTQLSANPDFNPLSNNLQLDEVNRARKPRPAEPDEYNSAESESSDFSNEFEIPPDVPDGPQFSDLASHIDRVKERLQSGDDHSYMNGIVDNVFPNANVDVTDGCLQSAEGPEVIAPWSATADASQFFPTAGDFAVDWGKANLTPLDTPPLSPNASISDVQSDDDEFGDFTCSQGVAPPPPSDKVDSECPPSTTQLEGVLERLLSHLESTLSTSFPTMLDEQPSIDRQVPSRDQFCTESCLWAKLLSPDRFRNRQFKWGKSAICQTQFRSLQIGKSHEAPLFATQLQLLEPTNPTSSDLHATEPKPSVKEQPPVSTSDKPIISEDIDLDFFEQRPITKIPSGNTPHLELSALDLDPLTNAPDVSTTQSTPPEFVPTQSNTNHHASPVKQSSNVRSVLSRLPKLSFMRARHLMFPVSETKPN